jgi:hypothetical protein
LEGGIYGEIQSGRQRLYHRIKYDSKKSDEEAALAAMPRKQGELPRRNKNQ